jgi:diketogulonate reductase-like aldo/keto reductase
MSTDAVTADGRARALSDGNRIPLLGLGVWQVADGPECVDAVRWALELGYRHIDTAQAYGNEVSVGQGLRESGVAREDVFITTKFYPARNDPVAEAETRDRQAAAAGAAAAGRARSTDAARPTTRRPWRTRCADR